MALYDVYVLFRDRNKIANLNNKSNYKLKVWTSFVRAISGGYQIWYYGSNLKTENLTAYPTYFQNLNELWWSLILNKILSVGIWFILIMLKPIFIFLDLKKIWLHLNKDPPNYLCGNSFFLWDPSLLGLDNLRRFLLYLQSQ